MLNRSLASRGKFPPVDVLDSVSRLMPRVSSEKHRAAAGKLREWMAHYEENRDLVQVGAYRPGADPLLDKALQKLGAIEELLYQGTGLRSHEETVQRMIELAEMELE